MAETNVFCTHNKHNSMPRFFFSIFVTFPSLLPPCFPFHYTLLPLSQREARGKAPISPPPPPPTINSKIPPLLPPPMFHAPPSTSGGGDVQNKNRSKFAVTVNLRIGKSPSFSFLLSPLFAFPNFFFSSLAFVRNDIPSLSPPLPPPWTTSRPLPPVASYLPFIPALPRNRAPQPRFPQIKAERSTSYPYTHPVFVQIRAVTWLWHPPPLFRRHA